MTLWTCIVADSGDRKTPGLNVTRRALDLIEKNNSAATSVKRLAHATLAQRAKEALKQWKRDRETALKSSPPREPPPIPSEAIDPGNFIEPLLYATDPTIERLAALLRARPRGMVLIRDELAGLFANMSRYSGGSDRPFWLEAWNGGRHVVERVSGSIVIEHLLVGVIGCFQPDKLARAFAGDDDGMCGRFVYAWPSAPDYRPLTNEAAEVDPELQSALTALIRLPSEDIDGAFTPQTICLSDGAIATFEEFRKWVDKTKRALDGNERQWLEPISKSPEEDDEASELHEAKEVLWIKLPAHEKTALPLNPGEEPLDQPAPRISSKSASILRRGLVAIGSVRCDHLDAVFT